MNSSGWLKALSLTNLLFEEWLSLSDKYFSVSIQVEDIDIQICRADAEQMSLLASGLIATAGTPRLQRLNYSPGCLGWETLNKWTFYDSRPSHSPLQSLSANICLPVHAPPLCATVPASPWPNFQLCRMFLLKINSTEKWNSPLNAKGILPHISLNTAARGNPTASRPDSVLMSSLLTVMQNGSSMQYEIRNQSQ